MERKLLAFAAIGLAIGVCGAGACGTAAVQPTGQSNPGNDLFDRLTAHAWDNNLPGTFGHAEQLLLRRDGTYQWHRASDVVERDQPGTWSFVASGEATGVARLSASGDLPFEFKDQKLRLGESRFESGKPIAYNDQERTCM
jgi:hypothetical protein